MMQEGNECPLRAAAERNPQAIALVDLGSRQRWTYAELDRWASATAARLDAAGITVGDRMGWTETGSYQAIPLVWGLLRVGAIAAPLSPRWPEELMRRAAAEAGLTARLSAEQVREWVGEPSARSAPRPGTVQPGTSRSQAVATGDPLATILFSSGSSGVPKAVAHSLSAHLASARGAIANQPLQAGDAWLLSLPTYHVSGLAVLFRCALAGATVVVASPTGSLPESLRAEPITHLSVVPTQLSRLLAQSEPVPDGIKLALLGGAPAPPELVSEAHRIGWPLATTYGLTEMGSQVTATPVGASREDLATSGRVLPERELTLDGDGQILVRGGPLAAGYLSGNTLRPLTDPAGWFGTGDLGALDRAGRLQVLGRRDNLFISGGENIHPEEIERHLLAIPEIGQAVVVPVTDREFGQRPVAFVDAAVLTPERWNERLLAELPKFKCPTHYWEWPAELVGLKPNRARFRQLAAERCGG